MRSGGRSAGFDTDSAQETDELVAAPLGLRNHLILERQKSCSGESKNQPLAEYIAEGFLEPAWIPFQTRARSLGRQADAAQQVLEARIRAQPVKNRFDIEIDHQIIAFLEAFFQPLKGAFLITNPHACFCHQH
jgi:hypothetical protein